MDGLGLPELIALVGGGGVVGTILTNLITAWLKRGDRKMDEATAIRQELRLQNKSLSDRLDAVEAELVACKKELDNWRDKFYSLQASFQILQAKDTTLQAQYAELQARYTTLQAQYAELQTRYTELNIKYVGVQTNYAEMILDKEAMQKDLNGMNIKYVEMVNDRNLMQKELMALRKQVDTLVAPKTPRPA